MVQNWRATFVLAAALATILAAPLESALAQPSGAPTDCTEATWSATIFIGHDCGQWASVMIAGRHGVVGCRSESRDDDQVLAAGQ